MNFIEARNLIQKFIIENCTDTKTEMELHSALSIMTQEHAASIARKNRIALSMAAKEENI